MHVLAEVQFVLLQKQLPQHWNSLKYSGTFPAPDPTALRQASRGGGQHCLSDLRDAIALIYGQGRNLRVTASD